MTVIASHDRQVSDAELLEKNRIYDTASDEVWRRVVYEPVHDGWEFTNMGGRHILDYVGQQLESSGGRSIVKLCSGLGDTCRYLASRFDCHVTGVEMNRRQIEQAREKISRDEALALLNLPLDLEIQAEKLNTAKEKVQMLNERLAALAKNAQVNPFSSLKRVTPRFDFATA